jgi:hypothetical protein
MSDGGGCAAVRVGSRATARRRRLVVAAMVAIGAVGMASCGAANDAETTAPSSSAAAAPDGTTAGSGPGNEGTAPGEESAVPEGEPTVEKVGTFARVNDVAVDPDGTPWVSDANNSVLVELASSGPVTHYTGEQTSTDPESEMSGLAIDADGAVWFATRKGIHRLDPETDEAQLVVPAASSELSGPIYRLAIDPDGVLFIGDVGQDKIFRLDGTTLVHVAGAGGAPPVGGAVEGPAKAAVFGETREIAVGGDGTIYVADDYSHLVHEITPEGVRRTFAGGGSVPTTTKGEPPPAGTSATELALQSPSSVWVVDETVFVVDSYSNTVLAIAADDGDVEVPLVPGVVTGGTTTWGAPGPEGEIYLVVGGGNVVRVTWGD